jgi:phosphonate transport system substrate-binding protein
MRDTDRNRVSYLVSRKTSVSELRQLRGRAIAVGASDSPQATLIPLAWLRRQTLIPGADFKIQRFDVLVGKHGDHVGGELDAFHSLGKGETDACAMLDLNWETWTRDGTIDPQEFGILATTDPFDHCVFTVLDSFDAAAERQWLDALFSMSYEEESHRHMMDLEGLEAWLPGRTSGFGPLTVAIVTERFFDGQ